MDHVITKRGHRSSIRTIESIFSILIILLPILYQYRGIGSAMALGEILLLPFVLYFMAGLFKQHKVKYNKYLLLFYVVTVFTTIINMAFAYFKLEDTITLFFRLVYYAIVVCVARKHFNYEYAKRIYIVIVCFVSTYLIVQYIYHYTIGGYLPMYLRYELLFPPEAGIRGKTIEEQFRWYYRASSIFLEPSYYSMFALPATCILLFQGNKNRFEKITFAITCVALVLSSASSGLLGLAILLMIYLFKKTKGTKTIWKIGLVFAAGLLVVIYFTQVSSSATLLNRLSYGGSFNQRIWRGWLVYRDLPIFHKLFGVGINNLQPYMRYYNISTAYDEANLNLSCSLIQTLNYSGIIGLVSLLAYIFAYRKKIHSSLTTAYFWLVVFIMMYETILFTYRFAYLIVVFEALLRAEMKTNEKSNVIKDKEYKNGFIKKKIYLHAFRYF